MPATRIDIIQAILDRRSIFCNDCANAEGGFDAGFRVCDDGASSTCSSCGGLAPRPIRNCTFLLDTPPSA